MENPIIEIRSAEDAAKWIGRKVCAGWRESPGGSAVPIRWRPQTGCGGTDDRRSAGAATVVAGVADTLQFDGTMVSIWSGNNDPIVIELLDGAATPRPEGEGWQWCRISEDVLVDFQGVPCDIVAMHRDTGDISSWRGIIPRDTSRPPLPLNPVVICEGGASVGVTYRGGAWIRKAEAPEEISTVQAARDRYDLAIAELAKASQIARDAQDELRERKALAERAAEDARYPLPKGWTWARASEGTFATCDDVNVFICGKDLEYSSGEDTAPLAVVRAVIARHDAENA